MKLHCIILSLLTLLSISCNSTVYMPCSYTPMETATNQYPEITEYENCAHLDKNETPVIHKNHLKQISFGDIDLAVIYVHNGIYYLNKKGKMARSHHFDNGADYFKEGLSRTILHNKFGFINKQLDIVIQPEYDFAFPFSNGSAKVCNGCKTVKTGEHSEIQGGEWGYIDHSGNITVEIIHSRNALKD